MPITLTSKQQKAIHRDPTVKQSISTMDQISLALVADPQTDVQSAGFCENFKSRFAPDRSEILCFQLWSIRVVRGVLLC